jgi:hypothetical protein
MRMARTCPGLLQQERARLLEENARLRQHCADLAASAEIWIHLYEAALRRAANRWA